MTCVDGINQYTCASMHNQLQSAGLAAKSSYVIPVVIVTVLVLAMAALLFGYIARVRRQRNGRMKLTDKHSESLPDPYPQHRTFENPIYQPCEKVIGVGCNDDIDALEALRLHIDQELLDISFLSDGESLGRRELKKTTSAPDLRNLNVTVRDMETSSVCAVDDLSQGSVGAVHNGVTQRSNDPRTNLKLSKEWLETFL
ncbi:PREDICTED: uncharacterized protein LOC107358288 [Acropora digitifera]|uniref:uncharacterized protein LOC107358288 n=1 Tax=Acropora digitifera TaxID=70779 RepID=UPI00077ABAF8|nr:PREDICTED: uncharacterized protein LOC107358288 [Acropora digitifera]